MRRFFLIVLTLVAAVIVLPPLYFSLFGDPPPELPAPGTFAELSDGTKLNVVETGSGPPVVLVHGHPGSAYDWHPLPEALAKHGFRVIAYDRKGYGYSDRRGADENFGFDQNGRELLGLIRDLGLRDVTVVGWSFGGGVTISAAGSDSSRIARTVLLASSGPLSEELGEDDEGPPLIVRILLSKPGRAWMAWVPPLSERAIGFFINAAFSGQPVPDHAVPLISANLARPGTRRTNEMEGVHRDPLTPEKLTRPVLVVHGTDDWFVPFEVGEDLAKRSGGALFSIDGGSHMVPVTHPEVIAKRIAEFIATSN